MAPPLHFCQICTFGRVDKNRISMLIESCSWAWPICAMFRQENQTEVIRAVLEVISQRCISQSYMMGWLDEWKMNETKLISR